MSQSAWTGRRRGLPQAPLLRALPGGVGEIWGREAMGFGSVPKSVGCGSKSNHQGTTGVFAGKQQGSSRAQGSSKEAAGKQQGSSREAAGKQQEAAGSRKHFKGGPLFLSEVSAIARAPYE